MAKYKDADELLKRLNSCKYPAEKTTMRQATYNAAISDACRIVDAIPAVDIPRWIPVAERRPEAYGRYLVTLEYEGYRSVMPLYYGRINRIDTFYDSDSEYGDIEYCGAIAWMPLPEPYKGGEEE